jgi:phage terminase large subunit GpA-like protein
VYAFTKRRAVRRVFAVKGRGGAGMPIVSRPTKRGVERALLFTVGTDTAKESIYSRLTLADTGPGYLHFPSDRPEDWFRQLVSEVKVTRYSNGVPFSKFENPSKARNEALDCRVYSMAALSLLQVNWDRVAAAVGKPAAKPRTKPRTYTLRDSGPAKGSGGFVNSW